MPKVHTVKSIHTSGSGSGGGDPSASATTTSAGPTQATILKRNQACHSCRRRKLKCDAKRPCSTCVRSLAHSKAHPQPGVVLPDDPDCTYDDPPATTIAEPPKSRFQKLENRIVELETYLLNDQPLPSANGLAPGADAMVSMAIDKALESIVPTSQERFTTAPIAPVATQTLDNVAPNINLTTFHPTPPGTSTSSSFGLPSVHTSPAHVSPVPSPNGQFSVIHQSWPRSLPAPGLTRHLVESFFSFHPHANRLFHQPTFMTSLSYPPSHPNFPSAAVLHAICAVGSMYTAAVPPTELPGRGMMPSTEVFQERYKDGSYVDGFAETHIKHAKQGLDHDISHGIRVVEAQQAAILIAWWYWCSGKWVEVYLTIGQIIKCLFPCGLHVSPLFKPLIQGMTGASLLAPAEDALQDELRRNLFWLAYALERLSGTGNSWPMSLDDEDVSQVLPVHETSFALGISWPDVNERQHPFTKDVLLKHEAGQIDSFGLYVKACMLLSRVKTFNLRFRVKRFCENDMARYSPKYSELWEGWLTDDVDDPRRTPAFVELQRIAEGFRASFPHSLQDPMASGTIDSHLFVANIIPHVALILLHDPHAHVETNCCQSAANVLRASRAILELLYAADSSSYDLSLLDYFCAFAWYAAGRVLIRFWQAAVQANIPEQADAFRTEVEYLESALLKAGRRVPLAQRYGTMLSENAFQTCGVNLRPSIASY